MVDHKMRDPLNFTRVKKAAPASEAELLFEKLLKSGLINPLAVDALPEAARAQLAHFTLGQQLLARLVDFKILTSYQAERVRIGNYLGMLLGKYRVLDRLGVGTAGVVFRGEHMETGQQVAIKVLIPARDQDAKPILRFFAERKTVAQLSHPGIVRALDVGETTPSHPDEPVLYYYVMEHVPGLDLEQHIQKNGPMQPSLACEMAYQVADALTEAHKHNLVHRDVKPSNIILTPEGRAMLLDFGLVRHIHSRQTAAGSLVGLLEWIAPEQAQNAHTVDIRADLYSLGCTLFWCLTGQSPYGVKGSLRTIALPSPTVPPPTVQAVRGDIAPELSAVVARMMASLPDDRYPTPAAVMAALVPFVSEQFALAGKIAQPDARPSVLPPPPPVVSTARILIVDDDPDVRRTCREALQEDGIACDEIGSGELALQAVEAVKPDLVLLDLTLPGMSGLEVLKQLRHAPQGADRKIIMLTDGACDIGPLLAAGADDYLTKPIDRVRLRSLVETALKVKETQDALQSESKIEERPETPRPASIWRVASNWLRGGKKQSPPPK